MFAERVRTVADACSACLGVVMAEVEPVRQLGETDCKG